MQLFSSFYTPSAYRGVLIRYLPAGGTEVSELIVDIKKNKLTVRASSPTLHASIDAFLDTLTNEYPVSLIIDGKGILQKKVTATPDKAQLLTQVIAGARQEDFFIQTVESGSAVHVSVCRRDRVPELFQKLKAKNILLSFVGLGPSCISYFPYPHAADGSFLLDAYTMHFEGSTLSTYEPGIDDAGNLKPFFNESDAEPKYALPFLAALCAITRQDGIGICTDYVQVQQKEIFHKNIFEKLKITLPVVILCILIVNFLLYSQYNTEANELSVLEASNTSVLHKLQELKADVEDKENFLKRAGWEENTRYSAYADRFASILPENIRLTEMTFNPINEKMTKELRKPVFDTGCMLVKGVCTNSYDFNTWVKQLESDTVFENISIIRYLFDKKEQEARFELQVFYESPM